MGLEGVLATAATNFVVSFALSYNESSNKKDLIDQGTDGRSSYMPNFLGSKKSDYVNRLELVAQTALGAGIGGMSYGISTGFFKQEAGYCVQTVIAGSVGAVTGGFLSKVIWRALHPKKVNFYRNVGKAKNDSSYAEQLLNNSQKNKITEYLASIEEKFEEKDSNEYIHLRKINDYLKGDIPNEGITEVEKWLKPQIIGRIARGEVRKEIRDFFEHNSKKLIFTSGKATVPEVRVYDLNPADRSFSVYDCKWKEPAHKNPPVTLVPVEKRADAGNYTWLENEFLSDLNKPRIIMEAGDKIPTKDKKEVISKIYLPLLLNQQNAVGSEAK